MKAISFTVLFFCLLSSGRAQKDSTKLWFNNYDFIKVVEFLQEKENKEAAEFHLLAQAYQKLGQIQEAYTNYQEAVLLDSLNVVYLNHLAEIQYKTGKNYLAYQNYTRLINLKPDNPFYYKKIGQVLNSASLSLIYQDLVSDLNGGVLPENDDLKSQLIRTIYESNYITSAIVAYSKAIELNPQDVESKLILIELNLKDNNINGADLLCRESMEQHPENSALIMQAIKIAYRLRDFDDVVAKSNLFYQVADSNLIVQKLEGIAHFHLSNFEQSVQLLENVISVDKTSEVTHYYLGLAYQEAGELKKSSEYLEKAIDLGITENIENYYTRLAIVYEELGFFEKSIQYYKAAYAQSKDKILLYHLARNYDVFYKDKNTALKYYELYLQENDTANEAYFNFSKNRLNELKVAKHFSLDTIH